MSPGIPIRLTNPQGRREEREKRQTETRSAQPSPASDCITTRAAVPAGGWPPACCLLPPLDVYYLDQNP